MRPPGPLAAPPMLGMAPGYLFVGVHARRLTAHEQRSRGQAGPHWTAVRGDMSLDAFLQATDGSECCSEQGSSISSSSTPLPHAKRLRKGDVNATGIQPGKLTLLSMCFNICRHVLNICRHLTLILDSVCVVYTKQVNEKFKKGNISIVEKAGKQDCTL